MSEIGLTGADIFDLVAGLRFNTIDSDGDEVVLDGSDFDDAEITSLLTAETVDYEDGFADSYTVSAPEKPWSGHHDDDEINEIDQGPFGERLRRHGLLPAGEPPSLPIAGLGPRSRPSDLAERLGCP